MFDVQVTQFKKVTTFTGNDVLALPASSIVKMDANVPGVGKLQPQVLMRTNCDAHPFVNLMTGNVLDFISDEMTFTYIPDVMQLVLNKRDDVDD